MKLSKLKTNNQVSPLGIDGTPLFSWVLESEKNNVIQKSYRIVVWDKEEIVWDSREVYSDQTICVEYQGNPLKSNIRYCWEVTVRSNIGETATECSWFETAFLDKREWQAKWVETPLERKIFKPGFGNQMGGTYFRKSFEVEKKPAKARLYATCHGVYQMFVNGERGDDREFAPEHTTYDKHLCYQVYDIKDKIITGENVLGFHVGDGWYPERVKYSKESADSDQHAILFEVHIEFSDGTKKTVFSDGSVLCAQSPIQSSYLFTGELYDATKEIEDWNRSGIEEKDWSRVNVKEYGYQNLRAQEGEPVRMYREFPVRKKLISPKGEIILDFNQNIAGRLKMKVDQPRNTKITVDYFEVLDKEGNCFDNIFTIKSNGQCQRMEYISNGEEAIYEPSFVFYGFRYVRIKGIENVDPDCFQAVVLTTEKEDVGHFECSNKKLNQLYQNTRWSQRANMISVPTDCPQREKAGWTGDIAMYARTALLNEDVINFLSRWLYDMSCTQGEDGLVPVVIPYDGRYPARCQELNKIITWQKSEEEITSAGWGDAAVLVPYQIYEVTGNVEVLKKNYQMMKKWCDYVIGRANIRNEKSELADDIEKWIWNTDFHFGEWLVPSMSKKGYGENAFAASEVTMKYTAPIFGWNSVSKISKIAEITGHEEDQKYYTEVASKMKKAIQKGVIGQHGEMPVDVMGAYVLPIYFDLVPKHLKNVFAKELIQSVEKNNFCLDTGFLGTPFLLDALTKIGRRDLAYKILYQEEAPSWLYQVKKGATTIWESWYCYDENNNPLEMSFNHYAYGCVDDWMYRNINGVEELEPGFKRILFRPRPDESLTEASYKFESSYGTIICNWKDVNSVLEMDIVVPCNTTAVIDLPQDNLKEVGSGRYHFSLKHS